MEHPLLLQHMQQKQHIWKAAREERKQQLDAKNSSRSLLMLKNPPDTNKRQKVTNRWAIQTSQAAGAQHRPFLQRASRNVCFTARLSMQGRASKTWLLSGFLKLIVLKLKLLGALHSFAVLVVMWDRRVPVQSASPPL